MSLLFESIKVANNILLNMDYHNARVNNARRKLFLKDEDWDLNELIQLPELDRNLVYKCRFVYDLKPQSILFQPYTLRQIHTLKLVSCPDIDYHFKFLDRRPLDFVKQEHRNFDDIIIVKNNMLTDCTFANIVFNDGTKWVTPASPLLKGTKRQKYINSQVLFEQDIKVSDLGLFTQARIINAMIDLDESPAISMDRIVV